MKVKGDVGSPQAGSKAKVSADRALEGLEGSAGFLTSQHELEVYKYVD